MQVLEGTIETMKLDVYGFANFDLEAARAAVKLAFGVRLVLHDSLYRGGDYYLLRFRAFEEIVLHLQTNVDLLHAPGDLPEEQWAEPEFPHIRTLLYVEAEDKNGELRHKALCIKHLEFLSSR